MRIVQGVKPFPDGDPRPVALRGTIIVHVFAGLDGQTGDGAAEGRPFPDRMKGGDDGARRIRFGVLFPADRQDLVAHARCNVIIGAHGDGRSRRSSRAHLDDRLHHGAGSFHGPHVDVVDPLEVVHVADDNGVDIPNGQFRFRERGDDGLVDQFHAVDVFPGTSLIGLTKTDNGYPFAHKNILLTRPRRTRSEPGHRDR